MKTAVRVALPLVVLFGMVLAAPRAQARLLDLHAGGHVGGLTGWGTTDNTPDFFDRRKGGGAGVDVGVKLLVLDLSLSFTQLFGGGTLSQALLAVTFDIPVGSLVFQDGVEKGKSRNVIRPILSAGAAIGTPEPVNPPLDNSQISDKGFVSYFGVGYEFFINEFMGVGAQVDYGYHYFFGGEKTMLSPTQTHSAGYQLDGWATLTFHLGI
jgi:hypothetical protein